ncbi:MAG TPA: hypothetical protein VF546_04615 [Pyrinomonadaceae bacterium]|jgi:ribosomal protein L12E/L44/L45/RPP1/RPP2
MERTQITLADGRYLIFYTFAEPAAPPPPAHVEAPAEHEAARPAPEAEEEERRV